MAPKPNSSSVRRQINENLKRVYDDALAEDVPERFSLLIEKLKAAEAKKDDS